MSKRIKLVDVRSPSEFARGHIPGAISLPLMGDDARKDVGTTYKKSGRFAAIQVGLSHVGPKLPKLIQYIKEEHKCEPDDDTQLIDPSFATFSI